jgi:sn-glycerol 3-phosphate transport system permease protein
MEAARVDGASAFGLFRWITFPLLSPVTFFLVIMNLVFSFFETFGIIHAVTQGGPGDTTTIMVYKTYVDGFVHLRMGYSAAQSVILMALVIVLTVLQFKYTERKVNY